MAFDKDKHAIHIAGHSSSTNKDQPSGQTVREILSAYASYTHVPRGFETSAEMSLDKAEAAINAHIDKANKDYLRSVLRARAKSNPNMTIKEFYEGGFKQRTQIQGQDL